MKRLSALILAFGIVISTVVYGYCATGSLEYNDYIVYDINNNNAVVSSGTFYSDTGGPMSTFSLYINPVINKWYITGGGQAIIPSPSGKTLEDNYNVLTTDGGVVVGSNVYHFQIVTQSDWYVAYNIPASSQNYPVLSIYLPFSTPSTPVIPSTPVLTISGTQLSWTPSNYTAKVLYSTTGQGVYDVYQTQVNGGQTTIMLDGSAYFRVQLYYTEDGTTKLTDASNQVYYQYTEPTPDDPDDENKTIWDYLSDIIDGIDIATKAVRNFLGNMRGFFRDLFSFLPEQVMAVFWAIVVIGLVFGLLLK